MIIGYYPGAGGNRYYEYINNREYSQPGVAYDHLTSASKISRRSLYFDTEIEPFFEDRDMLLHCVNVPTIKKYVKTEHNIIILNADFKAALRREWSIGSRYKPVFFTTKNSEWDFVNELYCAFKDQSWPIIKSFKDYYNLPRAILKEVEAELVKNKERSGASGVYNLLSSAFAAIVWNHDMYTRFPMDCTGGTQVNITTDNSEFAAMMRKELELYAENTLFNIAWEIYLDYGKDANLIDLYHEYFN